MTQEDKQLLLIDLCARLPYDVKTSNGHGILKLSPRTDVIYIVDNGHIPYLRPLSSITEEERVEFERLSFVYDTSDGSMLFGEKGLDWLNAHHFDYRGLIPMGLALEAPEGMYNKKESEKRNEIPIPKTVDEAVKTLAKIVSKEDRDYILENGAISVHDSLGRWIRNEWGLWTGSKLKNELKKKGFEHPDDMSNYIIEEFIEYCWDNQI